MSVNLHSFATERVKALCSTRSKCRPLTRDALLAQLLAMGFDIEEIERCQVIMATSFHSYSLQEATVTEW